MQSELSGGGHDAACSTRQVGKHRCLSHVMDKACRLIQLNMAHHVLPAVQPLALSLAETHPVWCLARLDGTVACDVGLARITLQHSNSHAAATVACETPASSFLRELHRMASDGTWQALSGAQHHLHPKPVCCTLLGSYSGWRMHMAHVSVRAGLPPCKRLAASHPDTGLQS